MVSVMNNIPFSSFGLPARGVFDSTLPANHQDNIMALCPVGYQPTALSNISCDWAIVRQTEKAVMIDGGKWFPKSAVLVEDNRIVAVKSFFYSQFKRQCGKSFGW